MKIKEKKRERRRGGGDEPSQSDLMFEIKAGGFNQNGKESKNVDDKQKARERERTSENEREQAYGARDDAQSE